MAGPAEQMPQFITYLLSPDQKHDCYFMVGNKTLRTPETIGAVKMMLMAHSEVFRAELEESEIAEKGVVLVQDLFPETFKNLLRYVYGYDHISELSFEDADNLLYAAEKYMIWSLKQKVAIQLMSLLSADNICSLLNNPACYKTLELDSAITTILQYETGRVLETPQFLELSTSGFIKILEQEALSVAELDIWRAAISWAKHKVSAGSEDEEGQALREPLSEPLKHIRVCTLTQDDFLDEVVQEEVLSVHEIKLVSLSVKRRETQSGLTDVCNNITPRIKRQQQHRLCDLKLTGFDRSTWGTCTSIMHVKPKWCNIEVLPFKLAARGKPSHEGEYITCECRGSVLITPASYNPNVPVTVVEFCKTVNYGEEFDVPISKGGRNVILLSNTHYTITVTINNVKSYYRDNSITCANEQIDITCLTVDGLYRSHVKTLAYKLYKISV